MSLLAANLNSDQTEQTNTFILARTDVEKSHFRAVQRALNRINIRVAVVRHSNILYICHNDHWRSKANSYIEAIGVFSLIGNINSVNNDYQLILKTMTDQVVSTLHDLFLRNGITVQQYEQMMYFNQSSTFQVNKLYFIAELHEVNCLVLS